MSNLQLSTFLMVPERGFAVTVLTNSGTGGALGAEVERWVLEKYLGLSAPAPATVELPAGKLDAYTGTYISKLFKIQISRKGSGLAMISRFNIDLGDLPPEERALFKHLFSAKPQRIQLGMLGPDRVVTVPGTARGEFLRPGPGAQVKWFRWGGRLLVKQPPTAG